MEKKFTPFGIRYEGDTCNIKVRYSQNKWDALGLENEYMCYRKMTTSGYIIFEISVPVNSQDYRTIINKINSAR